MEGEKREMKKNKIEGGNGERKKCEKKTIME